MWWWLTIGFFAVWAIAVVIELLWLRFRGDWEDEDERDSPRAVTARPDTQPSERGLEPPVPVEAARAE